MKKLANFAKPMLVVAISLLIFAGCPPVSNVNTVRFIQDYGLSNLRVINLTLTPVGAPSLNPDLLSGGFLGKGQSLTVTDVTSGSYDIRYQFFDFGGPGGTATVAVFGVQISGGRNFTFSLQGEGLVKSAETVY